MCKPAKRFKNRFNQYKRVIDPIFLNLSAKQQDHILRTIEIRVTK